MSRGIARALGALVWGWACFACSGDPGEPVVEATLEAIQEEVFADKCGFTGCHGSIQPAVGLDLSTAEKSYASLVDAPSETTSTPRLLVVPADPEASYLLNKLRGRAIESNDAYPGAGPMPVIGEPLADEAIDAIELWIADGCPP